jgi:hypothetical protein
MKKVMFALIAFVACGSVVNAGTKSVTPIEISKMQEEKVKIKPEEVPEAVKTAIKEDYQGWEISVAYKYTLKENFEVELKKDTETKTVKFDKEGNVID